MSQWDRDEGDLAQDARKRGFITYNLAPEDKIYVCPYLNSHRILEHRFSRHLVKCRENHKKDVARKGKTVEMGICKWNYMHHVPTIEIMSHEMMCPDAGRIVDHIMAAQNIKKNFGYDDDATSDALPMIAPVKGLQKNDTQAQPQAAAHEEDWESDVAANIRNGTGSYDPKIKLSLNKGLIVQQMPGITTKSERKQFRQAQTAAFEARGGDFNEDALSVPSQPSMQARASSSVDNMTDSTSTSDPRRFNVRLQREKEIAQAQRNASLSSEHQSSENRKRRSTQACDQISAILDLARSETVSASASSATLEADSVSNATGGLSMYD